MTEPAVAAIDADGGCSPVGSTSLTWRRAIFPGVFLVTLVQTAGGVADHSRGIGAAVGYLVLALFCVTYLAGIMLLGHADARKFWLSYSLLCALFLIETFYAHQDALPMLTFVGTLAIAVLWSRAIPLVLALIAIAVFLPPAVPSWHQDVDVEAGFTLAIVLGAMFAFFNLMRTNGELTEARARIATLAAEGERQRIARDLHDLLGHSLTTITVKAGLARRLSERGEADRAANEIKEVEELSRRSLADVRAAVAGYRVTTLTGELATGRELLRTLGIRAEFPPAADVVDPVHHELFGWMVREGLTNVVRHAHASACTISVGRDWIEIADDGASMGFSIGNGLVGLTERVEAAGGSLSAGRSDQGWVLRADMSGSGSSTTPDRPTSIGAGER